MTSSDAASERWLSRPDVWSGAVLGGVAAASSFAPSLMPRTTKHQALVSGASAALGFGLGGAVYGLAARTGSTKGDLAVLAGLGAGSVALRQGFPQRPGEPMWRPVLRSGGEMVAAGAAAAASGVIVRGSAERFAAGSTVAAAAAVLGARQVRTGLGQQRALLDEGDPPPPLPLPALTSSIGVASVLAALVNGYRSSGRAMARILERRVGLGPVPAEAVGDVLAVGLWAGTARALSNVFLQGMQLYDRVVDPGYDRAPDSACRSSGPGSPLVFARLGREGRHFVLDAPSTGEIGAVMGEPAVADPVRVFVGYAHARRPEERVALAMDELRRTGAFDRRLLVVGCPAGNGYVNTVPLEVLDHVLLGDVASVAVQYGRLPSFLTLRRVGLGGRVQRLLLEAIAAELASRPAERRPRVVLYGESLGAWAGQDTFLHQGVAGLDALGVDRALWVGTPYYSGWRHEVVATRTIPVPEGSVVEVGGPDELAALGPEGLRRLRAVLLVHDNDPVAYLSGALLVQEPPWLGAQRPARVPEAMAFSPVITTVEVAIDAVNATRPTPGRFRATGHEYDGDLPDVVLDAYGIERPDPTTWAGLVEHLQALDAARAAAMRALPEPQSAVPGSDADDDGRGGEGRRHTRRGRRRGLLRRRRARR